MAQSENDYEHLGPRVAAFLRELRNQPPPVEVVIARYALVAPIPDDPATYGLAAGQTGLRVVRYEPNDHGEAYVLGEAADGSSTWDTWHESVKDALDGVADGHYGEVRRLE